MDIDWISYPKKMYWIDCKPIISLLGIFLSRNQKQNHQARTTFKVVFNGIYSIFGLKFHVWDCWRWLVIWWLFPLIVFTWTVLIDVIDMYIDIIYKVRFNKEIITKIKLTSRKLTSHVQRGHFKKEQIVSQLQYFLGDTMDARNPKQPPGMVLKPVGNNGMNYHINWFLPDFWTINSMFEAQDVWFFHGLWATGFLSQKLTNGGSGIGSCRVWKKMHGAHH